jgi:hypothetical protein
MASRRPSRERQEIATSTSSIWNRDAIEVDGIIKEMAAIICTATAIAKKRKK